VTRPDRERDGPVWHAGAVSADLPDRTTFTCPRCSEEVEERFYGPCTTCRQALAAALGGERREVEVAAYEPKANVVPNQIATKD
jgi:hypothetical protein